MSGEVGPGEGDPRIVEDPWAAAWGGAAQAQGEVEQRAAAEQSAVPSTVRSTNAESQGANGHHVDPVSGWQDWSQPSDSSQDQRAWGDDRWRDSVWSGNTWWQDGQSGAWGQSQGGWRSSGRGCWQDGASWRAEATSAPAAESTRTSEGSAGDDHPGGHGVPEPQGQDTWIPRRSSTASATTSSHTTSGPSEKMAVPSFTADTTGEELGASARSYLRQIEAWTKVTRVPLEQRALILYQHLQGRAWIEAEELDVEALASVGGMGVFKKWVQERYQEVEVSKIAETLTVFFKKLKRHPGQTVREFNSAFDRAHTRLLEIECRLPEVAKAWAYLNALGLSSSEELALLASVNNEYNTTKLQRAATLHEKSLRTPWEFRRNNFYNGKHDDKKKGVRGVYTTDMDALDEEVSEGDDEDGVPEEVVIEIHEAYVAQENAKARFKELSRGRGMETDKGVPGSAAERLQLAKSRSFCAGCKRRGHWHRDPECPLNANKGTVPDKGSGGAKSSDTKGGTREAYVVHVAYELGDASVQGGLLAITDCACSKTVAGKSWLEAYLRLAKGAGLDLQFEPCAEEFRFGASKIFKANYNATIHFDIEGKYVAARASIVDGEVPLLLSRAVLAELGMLYDIAGHQANFTTLGVEGYKLRFTATGHPGFPVLPQKPGEYVPLAPKDWKHPEVQVIAPTSKQYTAFMTSADVACGSGALADARGPSLSSGAVEEAPGMFFPKKVGEVVANILTAETFNGEQFCKWWSSTNISNDFWIETARALYRIHVVPRRGLFDPRNWTTPHAEQREFLLSQLGEVRSTWGVSCLSHKSLLPHHDAWRFCSDHKDPFDVLWIGRSEFSRSAPAPPLRSPCSPDGSSSLPERMAHEQAGAAFAGERAQPDGSRFLRSRGNQECDPGTPSAEGRVQGAERLGVNDFGRTQGQSHRAPCCVPGAGHKGPPAKTHQRHDSPSGARGRQFRPLQECSLPGGARPVSPMEHARARGEPELQRRASEDGQLRQAEVRPDEPHVLPDPRPGGEREDPLRAVDCRVNSGVLDVVSVQPRPYPAEVRGQEQRLLHGHNAQGRDYGGQVSERDGARCPSGGHRGDTGLADPSGRADGSLQRHLPAGQGQDEGQVEQEQFYDCFEDVSGSSEKNIFEAANPNTAHDTHYEHYDGDGNVSAFAVEKFARDLRKGKEFTFERCSELLRLACPLGCSLPKRQAHDADDARLTLGAFAHGSFYGVTKKSYDLPETLRYLNAFCKQHGAKGRWSAMSVALNGGSDLHRDQHNTWGEKNQCISFGAHVGGRLWIEKAGELPTHNNIPAVGERHDILLDNGKSLPGAWYSAFKKFLTFDARQRHRPEPWQGDRFVITLYTPRGVEQLSREERDQLRSFGFPVSHNQEALQRNQTERSPSSREAHVRPRKSIRRQLWKQALKASAMLTLSMGAASSFLTEHFGSDSGVRPAIFEVGGSEMTHQAVAWGRDVVEPLDYDRFNEEDGALLASNTMELEPRVLWVHGEDADPNIPEKVKHLFQVQLQRGGVAVYEGLENGPLWEDGKFEDVFPGCDISMEYEGARPRVHVRPKDDDEAPIKVSDGQDDHFKPHAEQAFVQDVVPHAPPPIVSGAEGITFGPGVPPHIASALSRLHQNMGHPSAKDLTRHLRYAGADNAVLKASKTLKCQTCQRCQRTSAPRPASLPSLLEFNQVVSLDVFHVFDANRVRHELLSIIDHSTTYHQVRRITGHSSEDFENGFVEAWGRVFLCLPTWRQGCKQAGRYAEFCGTRLRAAAGQAHWQVGTVERHGRWYQEILARVIEEQSVTTTHEMDLAVAAACGAKNELRRKHGYSPTMAVLGREPRYPEELEGGHDDEMYLEIVSADRQSQARRLCHRRVCVLLQDRQECDQEWPLERPRCHSGRRRWQLLDQLRGPMPFGGK